MELTYKKVELYLYKKPFHHSPY